MSTTSRCVNPEKVIHEKDPSRDTQLTIGYDGEMGGRDSIRSVFACVCLLGLKPN